MASQAPLSSVEPRPMSETASGAPPIALRLGPESQIPDHPGSTVDLPRPSNNYGQGQVVGGTAAGAPLTSTPGPADAAQLRAQTQLALREYRDLLLRRRRAGRASAGAESPRSLEARLRGQRTAVLGNLHELQYEVHDMIKDAESHRWRRWLMGGAVASFIPLVRRIFRRGSDRESTESSNDTEYALRRSRGLLSRLGESILGGGSLAKVAFFVFAVLYVFQNEVTLRVAKTVSKRLKRLSERVQSGDQDITDKELKVLEGWRWRVLL